MELAQYAWITAAMAEGYGLDEVLPLEGLEPPVWEHAELSWRTRLATDLDIHEDYRSYLGNAEDALGGAVTPLSDDLESWVIFLKIYGDHPSPFELLAEQQLRPGDLARLQRRWARRLEEDDDVVKQADKLRKKMASRAEDGEELPLPAITVTPGALQASPYARELSAEAEQTAAAGARPAAPLSAPGEPQLSLYDYAGLCAALDDEGVDRKAVLETYGMSLEQGDRLERAWGAKMKADPALAADFRTLHRHFNEREGLRGETMPGHDYIPASPAAGQSPYAPVVVPSGAVPGSSPPPGRAPAPAAPATPAARSHPGPARGAPDSSPPPAPAPPIQAPLPAPAAPAPQIGYNAQLGMTLGVGDEVPVVDLPFSAKRRSDSAKDAPKDASNDDAKAPAPERRSPTAELASKAAADRRKKRDPHPEMGATALPGAKLPKITLPFKAKPSPDSDEAAAQPAPMPAAAATVALPEGPPASPAAPAAKAASPAAPAAKAASPSQSSEIFRTVDADFSIPQVTLPFKTRPKVGGAKDAAAPAPEPRPPGGSPTGTADAAKRQPAFHPELGATVGIGDNVPIVDLPFQEQLRAEVARRKAAAAGAQPPSKPEPPGRAAATPSSPPPGRAAATPSSPPPPQPQPSGSDAAGAPAATSDVAAQIAGWEVNHYASLCAELAEHPDHVAAIRSRYGLTDQAAEAYVHEVWQMRFIEDVEARTEWQRLLKQYREAIAKKK